MESAGIKFPDFKNSGVSLRSQRIKLPSSLGQKKTKGIEQMLNELRIGKNIQLIHVYALYAYLIVSEILQIIGKIVT